MTQSAAGAVTALALLFAAPLAAQDTVQDSGQDSGQGPGQNNAEIAAMFAADQAQRAAEIEDYEAAAKADEQRRVRARALLDPGALTTGADFFGAAFIFQHGTEPRDYLLAHILAVRSLGLGFKDAEWIAAATLDRYLQSIGQPQVYGTQYRFPEAGGVTMEPYDRALLVDSLRKAAGVGDLALQESKLGEYAKLVAGPAEAPAE